MKKLIFFLLVIFCVSRSEAQNGMFMPRTMDSTVIMYPCVVSIEDWPTTVLLSLNSDTLCFWFEKSQIVKDVVKMKPTQYLINGKKFTCVTTSVESKSCSGKREYVWIRGKNDLIITKK